MQKYSNTIDLPVGKLKLMTPFPNIQLTSKEVTLSNFSDKICVIHMYTG